MGSCRGAEWQVTHSDCPEVKGVVRGTMHSVLAIAPRKDYADFEEDLAEALVTYIVEVRPPPQMARTLFPGLDALHAHTLLVFSLQHHRSTPVAWRHAFPMLVRRSRTWC